MALRNHMSELERRHQALDRELRQAVAQPASDDAKLADLKRRKLQLKDELERLQRSAPPLN